MTTNYHDSIANIYVIDENFIQINPIYFMLNDVVNFLSLMLEFETISSEELINLNNKQNAKAKVEEAIICMIMCAKNFINIAITNNLLCDNFYYYDDYLLFELIKSKAKQNPYYDITFNEDNIIITKDNVIVSNKYFIGLDPIKDYYKYIDTNINLFSSLIYHVNTFRKKDFVLYPTENTHNCLYIYLFTYRINGQFIIKPGYTKNENERNVKTEFKLSDELLIGIFDVDHEDSEQKMHRFLKNTFNYNIPIKKYRTPTYNKYLFEQNNYSNISQIKEYIQTCFDEEDYENNSKTDVKKLKKNIISTETYIYNFNILTTTIKYCFMSMLNLKLEYENALNKGKELEAKIQAEKTKQAEEQTKQAEEQTKREQIELEKEKEQTKRKQIELEKEHIIFEQLKIKLLMMEFEKRDKNN